MSAPDLLAHLRSATRVTHERVEHRIGVLSRLTDATSYRSLLQALLIAYEPLERSVSLCAATEVAVPDWPRRLKSQWLREDLRALAGVMTGPGATVAGPQLSSAADVIGAVYVLEGATLGGAIVARALRDGPVALPSRFFRSYGDQRRAMWGAFRGHVRAFEDYQPAAVHAATAVLAAERTFEVIERACCNTAI